MRTWLVCAVCFLLLMPGFSRAEDKADPAPPAATDAAPAPAPSTDAAPAPAAATPAAPTPAASAAPTPAAATPATPAAAPAPAAPTDAKRTPVKISETSVLPLRVLTRAMSTLYKGPDEKSGAVQGNLPAFLPYYVYTRPGGEDRATEQGWYEVGSDNRGTIVGWLKAADVFEWKQTMCLTYAHPEMRKPVLMFASEQFLTDLVSKDASARTGAADGLYKTIESGAIPKDFSVVSIEPKMAVDFTKQFYLLPILDHKTINVDGREGRILQLAAVSGAAADAREKSDIRQNTTYAASASKSSSDAAGKVAKELNVDIVWAIDTTRSMGPYIDATRDVVVEVSKRLAADQETSKRIRFGVWGYRDPVEDIPGIEYTTRNFTPALQNINEFGKTMGTVKETKVDSVDFPEDVFSGLSDAIEKTVWTPGAMRIIVLVGDAPGHPLGHKWNLSGLDEATARSLATANKTTLLTIQIRPQGAVTFQQQAEKQFKTLALGPGMDTPAYYSVDGKDMHSFAAVTGTIVASLQQIVNEAQKGTLATVMAENKNLVEEQSGEMAALADKGAGAPKEAAQPQPAHDGGSAGLNQALKAALVQWIGSQAGAKPPRDVVAWVADKDLTDTTKQSLEVRLLINKRQLDSLATLLNDIIKAGRKGQISGDDFFTSLQAASAVASRDPDKLKNAKALGQSGLVPDFLSGLPYHSRLMDMSNELWGSWSPDEQDNFLNELDARIQTYKKLHDDPQGWVKLNEGADADESVYPIPLELLP